MNYSEIWLVDFEYKADPGELVIPHCMFVKEHFSGKVTRLWADEFGPQPPFDIGPDSLVVAYSVPAEMSCFLQLGWDIPANLLDLYVEYRRLTNGLTMKCKLLDALAYFGLDRLTGAEKDEMRELAIRGGPFSDTERSDLLDYCQTDVEALDQLLPRMVPNIDLKHALVRGRYGAAVAHMERLGIPIDTESLELLRDNWQNIQRELVRRIDARYGIYEDTTFKRDRFEQWLREAGINWPRLESGQLALDGDTFRDMAKSYPSVAPLRELRHIMSELRSINLTVGRDGRNRTALLPFWTKTGRNQPKPTQFIFGPSCWLRSLIKPKDGMAIAYVDWSQQEFAIAAALSGDVGMMEAYSSGDPYLAFAKQAGAIPNDATKHTHPQEREQFKTAALAVLYGMGAKSLSEKLGQPLIYGMHLLDAHRQTYPQFWKWSDNCVDYAMIHSRIKTCMGWALHVGQRVNPRSLANFPMQAHGAEMMRVAAIIMMERGIEVCCPVHDAFLVQGTDDNINEVVAQTQDAMAEAGRVILDYFELRTDADIYRFPERYSDRRGAEMWSVIINLCHEIPTANPLQNVQGDPLQNV